LVVVFEVSMLAALMSVALLARGEAPLVPDATAMSPKASCDLAWHSRRYLGKYLVLKGTYGWDWEWGAFLTFDGCKMPLRAPENEKVRIEKQRIFGRLTPQGSSSAIVFGHIVPASNCDWQGQPRPPERCDYLEVEQVHLLHPPLARD
jgi:hypothetical protein